MSRQRLLLAVPVLLLLLLATVKGCEAVVVADPSPTGCKQVVFSPESAPAGSHYFGDGSGNMQLSAEDMATAFKQAAACDPFQISVREMAWGLEPIPDEAARFARQQFLASDLGALTEASKRVNQIVDSSTFTVDTDWSGSYETLYAAATQDGWRAYKLRKSMSHETVLVQKTAGNRTFVWKVICLWQPVAEILRGYPVGPPSGALPPGQSPPRVPTTGTTVPPGTNPPGTGTQPPHTTQPPGTTTPPPTSPPTTRRPCTDNNHDGKCDTHVVGRPLPGGAGGPQAPDSDSTPDTQDPDGTHHGSDPGTGCHGTCTGGTPTTTRPAPPSTVQPTPTTVPATTAPTVPPPP